MSVWPSQRNAALPRASRSATLADAGRQTPGAVAAAPPTRPRSSHRATGGRSARASRASPTLARGAPTRRPPCRRARCAPTRTTLADARRRRAAAGDSREIPAIAGPRLVGSSRNRGEEHTVAEGKGRRLPMSLSACWQASTATAAFRRGCSGRTSNSGCGARYWGCGLSESRLRHSWPSSHWCCWSLHRLAERAVRHAPRWCAGQRAIPGPSATGLKCQRRGGQGRPTSPAPGTPWPGL